MYACLLAIVHILFVFVIILVYGLLLRFHETLPTTTSKEEVITQMS